MLIARSLEGVKVALLPLQLMPLAITGMCLKALSSNVCRLIVAQFIGRLKYTVTVVLMGTLVASSAGSVETTVGFGLCEAAAVPAIPRITTPAASVNLVTRYLTIVVIFLVEDMAIISLSTCV